MSQIMIEPDLNFIKGLTASGAESVKKCYQCATCSVVCNISPDGGPFPRKEMVWAQWGLVDKLAADPDVWLCHNCGDCTKHCPRGAKPAEVLGTLRKATIEKYALVKPFAAMASKGLVASMVVPAIIILGILGALGHLNPGVNYSEAAGHKELIFNDFFPIHVVDPLFTLAFFFAAGSMAYGVMKFWNDICDQARLGKYTGRNALPAIIPTIVQVFKHDVFANCGVNKDRKVPHLITLLSFIALFVTTNWAVFYLYALKWEPGQYSNLGNPLKWLGNLGAVAILVGSGWLIKNRKAKPDKDGNTGSTFDWSLLYLVFFVGLTGFGAEAMRLAKIAPAAYVVYMLHLILILTLFLFTPYSKLAHLAYRTTAMVFARHTGRNLKVAGE